jgi:hypothetical protein
MLTGRKHSLSRPIIKNRQIILLDSGKKLGPQITAMETVCIRTMIRMKKILMCADNEHIHRNVTKLKYLKISEIHAKIILRKKCN